MNRRSFFKNMAGCAALAMAMNLPLKVYQYETISMVDERDRFAAAGAQQFSRAVDNNIKEQILASIKPIKIV